MQTDILKAAIFTPLRGGRWGLPLLCWGEPGVAKTAVIEEICARYGLPCETLSPSERGEGAFGVVPVPHGTGDDMVLRYPRPDWTNKFAADGRGVVFVDEVTSTPPALQAALMGLLLARRVGGHELPKGVRVLGAANPPEVAAGGYDLAAPVANRVGHMQWERPDIDAHCAFMLRGEDGNDELEVTDAVDEERRVLKEWPTNWAMAVGLENAFLRARPSHKNKCPKAEDVAASLAWPSDRSWEAATRAYASGKVHGLSVTAAEVFVEAFVGGAVASEFFAFIAEQDLPNPADLLDGKVTFTHSKTRLDRTMAVLSSCAALVSPNAAAKRKDRAGAMWKILDEMTAAKFDLDIAVPSVTALIDASLHVMPEASKMLARLQPVLKAANVMPGQRR